MQPAGRSGRAPFLEHQVEDEEEVGIDVGDVHGRDDDYHQTSLELESPAEQRSGAMRRTILPFLLLAACAHAPPAPSPTPEVLATPAGVAEARGSWVSSTVRLARTEVMRGRFGPARTLLEPALDRAAAEGDAPGKARLEAELALVLAEESFYGRTGAERGVQLAQAAQASARTLGLPDVEAHALHAEGYLRYGEALWAEAKDFQVPRERFARARDLFREVKDGSGSRRRRSSSASPRSRKGSWSAPDRSMRKRSGAPRRPAIERRRRTRSATSRACPSRGVTSTRRSRCIAGASRSGRRSAFCAGSPTR
jgi:hypothetical protein